MIAGMSLPEIDAALDKAKNCWDRNPTSEVMFALIQAAETLRAQLFGSTRVDTDPMPVFVVRGKDNLAVAMVNHYLDLCIRHGLTAQAGEVAPAVEEIRRWRQRNRDKVQWPDHQHVPVTPPPSCDVAR